MYRKRWFGYDPNEVKQEAHRHTQELNALQAELSSVKSHIQELQARIEEYEIKNAALRRARLAQVSSDKTFPIPVTMTIGPVTTFTALTALADRLEEFTDVFAIKFRLFRDGIYRIDGWTDDVQAIADWTMNQPEVHKVTVDVDAIHALLK